MTSPAFGNVKFSEFDPGDSGLVGTSLLGAYNQAIIKYVKQVAAFNAANTTIPIASPDTTYDAESGQKTSTFSLLASKIYDVVTRKFVLTFATYSESYGTWVTPATGDLQGCTTLAEAIYLLANAVQLAYNILQPNLFVTDPTQFASLTDNNDGVVNGSITYLMTLATDPVTGADVLTINDLLKLVDDQQGV